MTTHTDTRTDRLLDEAGARLTRLTLDMRRLFDDRQVVALFGGALVATLLEQRTPADAAEYLRGLADEIDDDDGPPLAGTA